MSAEDSQKAGGETAGAQTGRDSTCRPATFGSPLAPRPSPGEKGLRWVRGLIFDFDGLLVDTEWAIYQSWLRLYRREGCALPLELFNTCLGSGYTHWDPGQYLEEQTGKTYDWEAENAARQIEIERDLLGAGLLPGARELLAEAEMRGLPMAVASSSSRRWVEGWLRRLGIFERFCGTFCRTDGYAVKPAPDLFLAARECLNIPASNCLVLEDSRNGVEAARRAGLPCVAIPNRVTEVGDFSAATFRAESLHDVRVLLASR